MLKTATMLSTLVVAFGLNTSEVRAQQMLIGTVQSFAMNFCPKGWVPADGRALSIRDNQDLFALIGTAFGGDGVSSFHVPNMTDTVARGGTFLAPPVNVVSNLGEETPGYAAAQSNVPVNQLTLTYCIAAEGIFPAR